MENPPFQHLMIAIIQEQDVEVATRALQELGVLIYHLASVGGFLGRRNATLVVAVPQGKVEQVRSTLQNSCRQRMEYLAIPLEGAPLSMPTPVPVTVGGATILTLPVERYEEF